MRKRVIIYGVPILILFALFFVNGFEKEAFFSQEFNQISSLKVSYKLLSESSDTLQQSKMESKSFTMEENKEEIKKFYGSIVNTKSTDHKNPDQYERQTQEPAFTIEVNYKDGKKDLIKSTERGMTIYRVYDDKGSWVGGENTELLKLINK